MHPNRAFHWDDREALLGFADERSFAHIFSATDDGLFVVHAPVLVVDGKVWFHIARRNRMVDQIDGRTILASISGREGYQSANWYASNDQVPTWHYEAVEIDGPARRLSDDELVELLDRLSEVMEQRLSPKAPWTRDKMTPGKFEAMTKAIVGFELDPVAVRGTRKFNQHKTGEDLRATIDGQAGVGRPDIVEAISELTRDD
jgi:transcriptional regulator